MPEQLSMACPQCSSKITVSRTEAGSTVSCLSCGQSFLLEKRSSSATSVSPVKLNRRSTAKTFGRFELQEILGEGAFGRVYRAYDPRLERVVALKIPTFSTSDESRISRFVDEAKIAARLRHPNIVPTFETGKVGERFFIASQFVDGQTLSQHVGDSSATIDQIVIWVESIAEALHYAHQQGVVHRDIKPDNIMIDHQGQPQIMDFGLAKRADGPNRTQDGKIIGTPAYMSPEQARGEVAVSPSSDQYSLGTVFYQLLTAQRPFDGDYRAVIVNVADEATEPPPPRSIRPEIPRDLETICQKAMSKAAVDRYENCNALAKDLACWRLQLPVSARRIGMPERAVRFMKRNPVVSSLLMILLVAFGTTLVLFQRNLNLMEEAGLNEDRIAQQLQQLSDLAQEQNRISTEKELREKELEEKQKQIELKSQELTAITQQKLDAEREFKAQSEAMARELGGAKEKLKVVQQEKSDLRIAAETKEREKRLSQYVANVRLANTRRLTGDILGASEALADCDPALFDWEWRYLKRSTSTLRWKSDEKNSIREMCFSRDGKWIAVCRERSGIRVLDSKSGDLIAELPDSAPRASKHIAMEKRVMRFSQSGRYLVASTWQFKDLVARHRAGGQLSLNPLWNLETGNSFPLPGMFTAFVGDQNHALTIRWYREGEEILRQSDQAYSPVYTIVDLDSNRTIGQQTFPVKVSATEIKKLPIKFLSTSQRIAELRFDRRKSRLTVATRVVYGSDSEEQTYQFVTSPPSVTFPLKGEFDLEQCDVNSSESVFVYANDNHVHVWDLKAGKEVKAIDVRNVSSISLSPTGAEVCIATRQKVQVEPTAPVKRPVIQLDRGNSAVFHPSKRQVLVADETHLRLHELPGQPIQTGQKRVNAIATSPVANTCVTGGSDGAIVCWDLSRNKARFRISAAHAGGVTSVCYSPTGNRIFTGGADNTVRIWNAESGKPVPSSIPTKNHTGGIRSLAIERTGNRIAVIDGFGSTSVYNLETGELVDSRSPNRRPKREPNHVNGALWTELNQEGSFLIAANRLFSDECNFEAWSPSLGRPGIGPRIGGATTIAKCPQSERIACGYESGRVIVWDPNTKSHDSIVDVQDVHRDPIASLSFNADGTRLATVAGGGISILDAKTGAEVLMLTIPDEKVERIAFDHEGNLLLATLTGSDQVYVLNGTRFP